MARLATGIRVSFFEMAQKILKSTGKSGTITDASLKSARLISTEEITLWEDLRLVLEDSALGAEGSEIYAKVISVAKGHEGTEGLVRFTSVSPEAYQILRRLLSLALGAVPKK